jgi:multidrug efflux pump subunit AcrB
MYLLGYSLDNLSLMGLTIATGFVVDDAIVMVENIARHLESGLKPLDAALKGAQEVGFTIVTMSLSLTAVFIPMFLMSGLIGRLFYEFAATVSAAIFVSAVVSLSLTPMMAAHLLSHSRRQSHGSLHQFAETCFDRMHASYDRGLRCVLRHRTITLLVTGGTVVLTGYLYVIIPKGFFPQQDTGLIFAVSEAAQDISYPAMLDRQARLVDIVLKDPAVGGAPSTRLSTMVVVHLPQATQ